ncbi:hypothetical protein [Aeromicrobium sp. Leaf350]|uniref:hypothetical protein n=1 Tax=Aeromicrobium sp. Leaf350 TaxID=2876565 RepID=UPI001E5C3EC9|nr:hypothetical protein [Aeromicrobium sp. Leaf350]
MPRLRPSVLTVVALLVTLPYAALKVHWLLGGRTGIVDPSFGDGAAMWGLNAATLAMDLTLVILVAALTGSRRRLPAWLLLPPAWVATGLLLPIVVAVAVALPQGTLTATDADSPLRGWVFATVYSSLSAQALVLATAFLTHARARWGGRWSRRSGPVVVVLWCSSAVIATWSAYALVLAALPVDLEPGGPVVTYAVGLAAGLVLAVLGMRFVAHGLRSTTNHDDARRTDAGAPRRAGTR